MKDKFIEFFKANKTSIIMPTVVMVIICLVVTLALSVSNLVTKPKIEELEAKTAKEALQKVMPADTYSERQVDTDDGKIDYFEASNGEEALGYIFTVTEKGYGGEVKVMAAILPDLTIKSVEVLDVTSETVGLGQNTAKESFYSQYSGRGANISVVKNNPDKSKNEIQATTGATISSKAVTKAVNKAIDYASKIDNSVKGGAK